MPTVPCIFSVYGQHISFFIHSGVEKKPFRFTQIRKNGKYSLSVRNAFFSSAENPQDTKVIHKVINNLWITSYDLPWIVWNLRKKQTKSLPLPSKGAPLFHIPSSADGFFRQNFRQKNSSLFPFLLRYVKTAACHGGTSHFDSVFQYSKSYPQPQ